MPVARSEGLTWKFWKWEFVAQNWNIFQFFGIGLIVLLFVAFANNSLSYQFKSCGMSEGEAGSVSDLPAFEEISSLSSSQQTPKPIADVVEFPPAAEYPRGPLLQGLPVFNPWFSYHSVDNVLLMDPNGSAVELELLGRFVGEGDYVWVYKPKSPGLYKLFHGSNLLKVIDMTTNSMVCRKPPAEFETQFSCHKDDLARVKRMTKRWKLRSVAPDFYNNSGFQHHFRHIVIVNNTMYMKPRDGNYLKYFLAWTQLLLRNVNIPDVEFFYSPNDNGIGFSKERIPPVLQFCQQEHDSDVLIPSGYVLSDLMSGKFIRRAANAIAWEQKKKKCFYRASDFGILNWFFKDKVVLRGRLRAATMAARRSDVLDMKIFVQREDDKVDAILNLSVAVRKWSKESERLQYMCTVSMDGCCASWNLATRLVEGNVVLKQASPFLEHYYDHLKPGQNIVEFNHYFDNLIAKAEEVVTNPNAKQIALNGFSMAMTRLREEDILCWLLYVFLELSQKSERVFVREGMERVEDKEVYF